jgi:hypothetical protein
MATLNQHIFFMGGIILLNILQVVSHTLSPPLMVILLSPRQQSCEEI